MTVIISENYQGRLLRSFLKHTLGLSSASLARLKAREDGIRIDGVRVTLRYVLQSGDRLELALDDTPETATETVLPVEGPLNILYEDDALIILNKPAGMPTHPSHGHLTDTLANALAYRCATAGVPFVFRPMGRLDKDTSGVVVAAKTAAVAGSLGNCLIEHRVTKRYLAVLEGHLPQDEQTHRIELPILRPAVGVAMRTVCPEGTPAEGADYALTTYRVLASSPTHTLVLARPHTGRTHQLRVHFAALGHPLCGDGIYGTPPDPSSLIQRQALHCLSLSFPYPFSSLVDRHAKTPPVPDPAEPVFCPSGSGWMHSFAPLPPDMESLIRAEFPHYPAICDLLLPEPRAAWLLEMDGPSPSTAR